MKKGRAYKPYPFFICSISINMGVFAAGYADDRQQKNIASVVSAY
jgi:hypothetical protein